MAKGEILYMYIHTYIAEGEEGIYGVIRLSGVGVGRGFHEERIA